MFPLVFVAVGVMIGVVDQEPAVDLKEYNQLKAVAGRDADSQVKLALWCEAHGLETERMKHLAIAVLANPSHTLARGLLGLVEYQGKWKRPDDLAKSLQNDVAHADLIAEYNGKRVQTPVAAVPQYKLGLWCEEKGLKDEARAHFATVVRLDPNHTDAWKKLGYKKSGNRWLTDAQASSIKVEKQAQERADKAWRPKLEKLRDSLAAKGNHEAAEKTLSEITDPRAVPMIWQVFVQKGQAHHPRAVQLFGQIDAIEASRALATLAIFSPNTDARRRATETLRRRDAREYADLLITLLQDKIKYEVKHVGGPGSPGEIFVAGKKANFKRVYAPPGAPQVAMMPGDTIQYDANGLPVLVRQQYSYGGTIPITPGNISAPGNYPTFASLYPGLSDPAVIAKNGNQLRANLPKGMGITDSQVADLELFFDPKAQLIHDATMNGRVVETGMPGWTLRYITLINNDQTRIPVGRATMEAQRVAMSAEEQLKSDLKILDDENKGIGEWNDRVGFILKTATGINLPLEPQFWQKWFVNQVGYRYNLTTPDEVPTIVENAPLLDQARPIPIETTHRINLETFRMSCFGKGTLVRTVDGPRAIETLSIGDRVLTQDTHTGKLGYQPITHVHRNPPSETYRITLDGRPIVSSYFHRFWKVGHGWMMARDLKVDDPIRILGGVTKITAIERDKVQPVFNLDVANDANFFAGEVAALVHDNTLPDLKQTPFDAPAAFAAAKP